MANCETYKIVFVTATSVPYIMSIQCVVARLPLIKR